MKACDSWVNSSALGPEVSVMFGNGNSHKRPQPGLHLFSGKLLALGWETLLTSAFFGLLMSELILRMGLLLDPGSFLEGHSGGTV